MYTGTNGRCDKALRAGRAGEKNWRREETAGGELRKAEWNCLAANGSELRLPGR